MQTNLYKIFFTLVCLFIGIAAKSQNIYDSAHSFRYANYLFKSKEYARAANEYERTCFQDSQNWVAHYYLLKSYRKIGQEKKGMNHFTKIYDQLPLKEKLKFEHENNICTFRVNPTYFATKKDTDSLSDMPYFKSPSILLSHNWVDSKRYLTAINYKDDKTLSKYYQISLDGMKLSYKKPWLAGTLSTILPGLGKFYTGYTKDGLIALLMTGISGYQAYRGYSSKGVKSGIFIIYTGMTAGFYFGNIYGSIKSAKQKNNKLNELLDKKTNEIFYEWAE